MLLSSSAAAAESVADGDSRWQTVDVSREDLASNASLAGRLLAVQKKEGPRKVLLDLRKCSRLDFRDSGTDARRALWPTADRVAHAPPAQPPPGGLLDFSVRIIALRRKSDPHFSSTTMSEYMYEQLEYA